MICEKIYKDGNLLTLIRAMHQILLTTTLAESEFERYSRNLES